jgi:uncharacterized repeat protein (TIGR02543 family)
MKKLLKTLACSAVAALVGASAFAAAGWIGAGAIYIGEKVEEGVCNGWYYADQHGSTSWCSGPFQDADLGSLTSLTLGGQLQLWDEGYADWGSGSTAMMYYSIDGGAEQLITLNYYKYQDNNNFFQSGGDPMVATAVSLDSLDPGPHTLAIYFDDFDSRKTTPTYTATFTLLPSQTVTFNLNGGDSCPVSTLTFPIGGLYEGFEPAVWENHIFRGWWTDPTDGTRVRTNETVSAVSSLTLYAHWTAAQTVTFDANGEGAVVSQDTKMCPHGGNYSGFASATWDGHVFKGWYDDPTGGTRISSGMSVTDPDTRTLYAHWDEVQTVYFNANGEGAVVSKPSTQCSATGNYSGFASATWEGHIFRGWYDDPTGGTRVKGGMPVAGGSTRTLYAHWDAVQTVTFDANGDGATSSKPSVQCLIGGNYSGLASATWDGHVFKGWFDDPTDGERVKAGLPVTEAASRTLYAHWKESASAATAVITGFSFSPRAKAGARAVTTVTDTLDRALTGVTGTGYVSWSGKTNHSAAVYAGQSAGGNSSIQLRSNNSNSGIVTTESGGKVTKVTIDWNSNTSAANSVDIYGKDSAYSAPTDLYNASTSGTKIGSLTNGTTVLTITNGPTFIGLRSHSGAVYLNSVSIDWEVGTPDPTEPTVTLEASATNVVEGTAVTITATATNFSGGVSWAWKVNGTLDGTQTGDTYTLSSTTAAGDYEITATASYGESESATASVTVTVATPPSPSVTLSPTATNVVEGTAVTIAATAENFSGGVSWSWTVNGNPDAPSGDTFTLASTTAVGDYVIAATAAYGAESATESVTITVTEAPVTENFTLISSVSELQNGRRVILTNPDSNRALTTNIASSVFTTTNVAPVSDVISTDDESIIWTLVDDGSGNFSLYNEEAGEYAGHGGGGSSNSGQLQTNPFPHTITFSNGLFKLTATNSDSAGNKRALQYNYNNGNPRFAYYKSTQTNLNIYAAPAAVVPTVTLVASATNVEVGAEVTITATATGFSGDLEWEWSVNGTVDGTQTNTTYSLDTSSADTYVVTATATDWVDIDDASVTITVNEPASVHDVVIDTPDGHGTVEADPESALPGVTVSLSVDPDDGYILDTLTAIAYTSSEPITVTDLSFVMPNDDVWVTATFKEVMEYVQITSMNAMQDGEFVITGTGTNGQFAMKAAGTSFIQRRDTAVTIEGGSVIDAEASILWTLAKNDDGQWTIYNSATGYVGYVASGNSAGFESEASDASRWIFEESGSNDGLFQLQNVGTTSRYLKYNSGSPRFACYESGQKNLALYRKKVPRQRIDFNVNGEGASCEVDWLELDVCSLYTNFVPATWSNHIFKGWWTDAADGTRVRMGEEVTTNSTLQLYAHWQAAQTVYFEANGEGAVCSKPSTMCVSGGNYSGLASATWEGHVFKGWYDDPTAGSRVKSGMPVTGDATRTLYAHWEEVQTVYFNANGEGAIVSKDSTQCSTSGNYSGFASATWENHIFKGWYDDPTDGERVKTGMAVTGGSTRTLYAHWVAVQTVSFNANGEGAVSSKATTQCRIGGNYSGLASATWEGHVFKGWYDDPTDGERIKSGMPVTEAATRTLYAHWKESAAAAGITGFSVAHRVVAGPASRSADSSAVECSLWVLTTANCVYEIQWTDSLLGEWTVLKHWTADEDAETLVSVVPPASSIGFFRLVEIKN